MVGRSIEQDRGLQHSDFDPGAFQDKGLQLNVAADTSAGLQLG